MDLDKSYINKQEDKKLHIVNIICENMLETIILRLE